MSDEIGLVAQELMSDVDGSPVDFANEDQNGQYTNSRNDVDEINPDDYNSLLANEELLSDDPDAHVDFDSVEQLGRQSENKETISSPKETDFNETGKAPESSNNQSPQKTGDAVNLDETKNPENGNSWSQQYHDYRSPEFIHETDHFSETYAPGHHGDTAEELTKGENEEGEFSGREDDSQNELNADVQDSNDDDNDGNEDSNNDDDHIDDGEDDDEGEVEIVGSRQVSVVELDSEDEIDNLEEEVFDSSAFSDGSQSIQLGYPVILTFENDPFLLVPYEGEETEFKDLIALFNREDINDCSLKRFFQLIRENKEFSDAYGLHIDNELVLKFGDYLHVGEDNVSTHNVKILDLIENIHRLMLNSDLDGQKVLIVVSLQQRLYQRYLQLAQAAKTGKALSQLITDHLFQLLDEDSVPKKRKLSS